MEKILSIWQRNLLGVLGIGGGAVGLNSIITNVFQGHVVPSNALFAMVFAIIFFAFGIWCGVLLLTGAPHALNMNTIFWVLQVPLLQTPIFSYIAFCGAQLQILFKFAPFEFGFLGTIIGAQFGINLGQVGARIGFGLNVAALFISCFLMRSRARA